MRKKEQPRTMHHILAVVVALFLIIGVNGLFDDNTIVGKAGEEPTMLSSTSLGLPMCQGGDIGRLEGDSTFGGCADITNIIIEGMERNGLMAFGIDPLSVLMLIHAESGCQNRAQMEQDAMQLSGDAQRRALYKARGGLMQVDRCLLGTDENPDPCTTTEINVDHGTRELKESFERTIREEFTGQDVYWLAWLGYARGTDTSSMAMRLIEDGASIQEATDQACAHHFGHPDGECGVAECEDGDNHCRDRKRCDYAFYCRIRYPGVGVHYSDHIWTKYEQACSTIGGELVNGGTPSVGSIIHVPGSTSGLGADVAGENVIVGDYTINPAFRVNVDYDMVDYTVVQDAVFGETGLVNRIEVCERRGDQIDSCIQSTMENINLEHSGLNDAQITLIEGPCDPEENMKSDLVEGYADCRASDDTACVCDVELEQAPQNDPTEVEIELTRERPTQMNIDIDTQINFLSTHSVRNLDSTPIFTELDNIEINVPQQGAQVKLYKSQDTIYYVKDNQASEIRACTMQKRTYKFCARKEGHSLWRLVNGEPVRETPQIKFALTFPDVTPPPVVTGVIVRDATFAQNTLLIMWDKSPAQDTEEYELFFAPSIRNAFSEQRDLAVLRTEVDTIHASRRTMRMQRYESALPSSCQIDLEQLRCVYTLSPGQEIVLEPGVLYEFDDGSDQKMVTLLPVGRDTAYQVGIVAIDGHGNSIDTTTTQLLIDAGTSIDDLPPGLTIMPEPETAIVAGRSVGVIGSSWVEDGRFLRTIAAHCTGHMFEKHGYTGQGTGSLLSHFDEDIIENRYGQVMIVTTINDLGNPGRSMESIKNNLAQMYQLGHDSGMRVIATTVFPWQGYNEEGKTAEQLNYRHRRTHELNEWIRSHPPNVDAVIDAGNALVDPSRPDYMNSDYTNDGVHMNSLGNAILGEEMFEQAFRGQDGCDE